jgi:hypothetical protein
VQHLQEGDQPGEGKIAPLDVGQFVQKNAAQFLREKAVEDAVG